ncbi:hypothetical protein [Flavobacterium sp.]|uniref:hypothetical protein n=1 Tax=Flavobacterium sp. TaxID=239 RepID=UPI003F69F131
MKKIVVTAILLATTSFYAQVGIGTTNPEGALDVVSTNSGIVVPRVANTASVTTPINGMIIYDLSSNCFKGYQNGAWSDCGFVPVNPILVQVGNEGDAPNTVPSVVTAAQLASVPGVTDVVSANEAGYQAYIDANPALFSAPATVAEVNAMIAAVNATAPTTITSTTGKIWMDRNLGATQVATSVTDYLAYGDLYQWGRKADGHEKITWSNSTTGSPVNGTTTIQADIPADNLFITEAVSPFDWRVNSDDNLWTGVAAVNNPCPWGFRVPTNAELSAEITAYSITNRTSAFNSPFKFTVSGLRFLSDGNVNFEGTNGYYWTSSTSGNNAIYRYFFSGSTSEFNYGRTYGFSVRCIKG